MSGSGQGWWWRASGHIPVDRRNGTRTPAAHARPPRARQHPQACPSAEPPRAPLPSTHLPQPPHPHPPARISRVGQHGEPRLQREQRHDGGTEGVKGGVQRGRRARLAQRVAVEHLLAGRLGVCTGRGGAEVVGAAAGWLEVGRLRAPWPCPLGFQAPAGHDVLFTWQQDTQSSPPALSIFQPIGG